MSRNRKTNIYLGTTQCIPFRPLLPYFIWYAFHELGGKIVHSIVDEWPKATVTWPLRKLIFLEHKAMAMLTLSFVAFFKKSLFLHLTKILFSVLYCLFYRKSLFQTYVSYITVLSHVVYVLQFHIENVELLKWRRRQCFQNLDLFILLYEYNPKMYVQIPSG